MPSKGTFITTCDGMWVSPGTLIRLVSIDCIMYVAEALAHQCTCHGTCSYYIPLVTQKQMHTCVWGGCGVPTLPTYVNDGLAVVFCM